MRGALLVLTLFLLAFIFMTAMGWWGLGVLAAIVVAAMATKRDERSLRQRAALRARRAEMPAAAPGAPESRGFIGRVTFGAGQRRLRTAMDRIRIVNDKP